MALTQSALFLALVSTALAGPVMVSDVTSNNCASSCDVESMKFGYETGKTYRYTYKSEVITHIAGANTEKSKLNVQAVADVEVLSPCEMLLKLTDVELTDSHPERLTSKNNVERAWEFKRSLQQRSLRFGFKDGQVEAVCPDAEEETWALNIKRAILSGLQNTMHDLGTHTRNKESDVSGDCYVDYAVESLWTGYKITKVKDVLSCSGHAHYDPFLQTTRFTSNSRIQSLPLIKSTSQCEQVINSGKIITASTCQEKHVFRPFSTQVSGATTEVTSTLQHTRTFTSSRTAQSTISIRKSLVFDYEPTEEQSQTENRRGVTEVKSLMSRICGQTETNIDPAAPATYAELVRKMRQLTPDQLSTVHSQIKASPACPRAEAFLHDALPSLGTPASARLMGVLLSSGELSTKEADKWLTSLSFVARPTRELLADVKALLVQNVSFRKSTLAVTSLINNYCRLYSDCEDHAEVRAILSILDETLGYNCAFRNQQEYSKILSALKGIGNAGRADRLVPKLNRCLLNRELPMELRVTVVTAFRRMPCTADRAELLNTFLSTEQDSELRIAAYLGLMACPTTDILSRIQRRLETEEVNQVGSFVWTHLTNLQTTSSPLKQELRKILENQELKKTFDMDKRKFSRNIEWSTFSESLNAGLTMDSNLVWSPKSFVPRSASVNLTVDMFGESLNLVEVGGRAEGIDSLLEKLFGPNKDIDNHIPNMGRTRRSANNRNDMNRIHNRFGMSRDAPKGSYYLRMFGNEIRFDDFQEFDTGNIFSKLDLSATMEKLARQHTIDHTSSGVLFDVAMVVPTVAGLPLRLRADGTSVVNMKAQGKVDLRRLKNSPPAVDIEGTIRPSGAVQVNAEMGVDATMARSGVKMVNTLRSNTLLAGRMEARNGGIFNLDINMPDDTIELFDATSKFFIEYRDTSREQTMLTEGRIEKRACTDNTLVKMSGLELCARLSAPHAYKVATAPRYPLTGPTTISLVLSKKETYRGMHFETKFAKEQVAGITGTKDTIKISFSTPGSRIDREFTFEYVLDNPEKTVEINLKTPFKTVGFTGSLVDTDNRKGLKATGTVDSDTYDFVARIDVVKTKYNTQYRPLIEVTIPDRPVYRSRGSILYRPGKKAVVDMRMDNIMEGPIAVKGSVDFNKRSNSYSAALELESSGFDARIEGSLENASKRGSKSEIKIEYTKTGGTKQTLEHNLEWKLTSVTPKLEFEVKTDLTTSQWPEYNSDLDFSIAADSDAGQLDLVAGKTDSPKRVTFGTRYTKSFGRDRKTGEASINFVLPHMNWNHRAQGDFQIADELFKLKLQRRYGSSVSNLVMHLARQSVKPLKTLIELSFDSPGRHHLLKDTVVESTTGTYDHDLILDLSHDYKIRVDSTVKRLPRPEIIADITIPEKYPIKVEGFVNPELTDFSTSAKVEYGRDVYSTATSWRFTKVGSTITSDSKFELVYPQRTITAKSKMSSSRQTTQSELEILWDAKRDQSKRFMIKTDASSNSRSPRMNLRTEWYPAKFIDVTLSGKNDRKGWSHPVRDLEARILLQSSFETARQISALVSHTQTSRQVNTRSEISWANNKKINTALTATKRNGWQDALIVIETTTPFDVFKSSKFVNDYSVRGNTYDIKNRLDWDSKFVELTMTANGDPSRRSFEGGVTLLTSYEGYNRMALTAKHMDNGRIFNSQLQGTWRDGSNLAIVSNVNFERTNWFITTSGDLTISLPVGPYRNNKLSWNHRNNAQIFTSHIDLELDNEKTVWDLDSTLRKSASQVNFNLKTTFTSPYKPVKNLAFDVSHRHVPGSGEGVITRSSIKWAERKIITILSKTDNRPGQFYKDLFEMTTPFEGYEKITMKNEYKIVGDKFELLRELKYGTNRMAFDGFVMLTFPETSAEFRLVTPYTNAERFLFKMENKKVNGIWQAEARFDYPGNNKIEVSGKLGMEAKKKFQLEIKTPYPYIEMLLVDLDHVGPANNFQTKLQIAHNMMDGRIISTLESDVSNLEDIKIEFGFTSPFEEVAFIRSGFTHKDTNERFDTAYTFEYPGYKAGVTSNIIIKNYDDFENKLTIEYAGKKIELGNKFKMNPVFRFTSFLKAPYDGYRNNVLNIQYDGRVNTLITTEITYGDDQNLALNIDYRNQDGRYAGRIGVNTPFEGYEENSLTFNHQGKWNNFKNSGTLSVGGRTFEASGEFLYRPNKIKMEGEMKTPYEGYRTISLSFDHEGNPMDMKQELEFAYGENEIKITHEFKFNKQNKRLTHKLFIITPFSALSSLRSEIKHGGPWKNFRNEGTLEYNGRVYSGNTQFVYGKKAVRGSITVNNPEAYTVRFNHKGEADDFTNNIQASLNGRSYTANTQFKFTARSVEMSTSIRTPHRQMRVMQASLNHRGTLKNFQNRFTLNINDKSYTGQAQLRVAGNDITGSAEFKLPKVYGINFAHKGPLQRFENSIDITYDTSKYEADSYYRYANGAVSGRVGVKIPQEYSLTFSHTGSQMNFADQVNLKMGAKEASGNINFEYEGNDLTASAGLILPIKDYEKFSGEIKHSGTANRFKTEAIVDLPFNKVKKLNFEVDHTSNLPEFNTKAVIGYNRRQYGFGLSYEGNSNDFITKASMEYGSKKFETEVKWKQTGSMPYMTHDGSIRIVTPYKYLTSAETKLSHRINSYVYSGQMESLYNNEKYFDTEYTFSNGEKKELSLTMREPHPAHMTFNFEMTRYTIDTDAFVSWDTSDDDSNVKVVLSAKCRPKYEMLFKVIRPNQLAMFMTDLETTSQSFSHGSTVQWGRGDSRKTVYNLSGRRNSNGRNQVYSGNFRLRSPIQNMEASLEHENKARSVKTVLEMGNIEKLVVIHEFVMREPEFRNFKSDFIIRHPQLQKDIKLKLSGLFFRPRSLGGGMTKTYYMEGRANLLFANDDILFEAKLGDASRPEETKYIAFSKLAYPRAGINSQALVEATARDQTLGGQIKLDHMSAVDGQWKSLHFISNINKMDKNMDIEFKSPYNEDLYVRGNLIPGAQSGVYNVDVTSRMGTNRVRADLALDKNAPLMDFKLDYKPDAQFRMYAKYLSSSTAQFEAYRRIAGVKILDSQLAVRLNNSRLIHARAYFRPEVISDIEDCIEHDHGMQEVLTQIKTNMNSELDAMSRKVDYRFRPLKTFVQRATDRAEEIMSTARDSYTRAYNKDQYYLKTSHQFVAKNHAAVKRFMSSQYNKYKPMMDRHFAKMAETWEQTQTRMAEQMRANHASFVNHASNAYNNMVTSYRNSKKQFEDFLNAPWFTQMAEHYTRTKTQMDNWIKNSIDSVRTHPYVEPVVEWMTSLPEHEYFVPLRNFNNDMAAHFTRMGEGLRASYDQTYQDVQSTFDMEEMRRLQEWFQDKMNEGKRAYTYYGLEDAENYLRGLSASSLDELKDRAITALRNYIKPEKTRVTVWDTTRGDFQVEVYLPLQLRNIRDFPVDDARRLVTRMRKLADRLTPDENWTLYDTILAYRISPNPRDWIPPFKSHATVAGSQHYMTFDKKFYEYSGECSYVLAHDFIDGNFSVIINYDTVDSRMTKKSITVLSGGKEVEIFPSFKVTIDNKQTELPVEFDDTSVIRQGNRIRLDNDKGLTVSCDLAYDRCTVNVTGWYFAKTGGMLGTYNNEPFDDLLTAEKRLATRPELLADSWTIGSKCRVVNNAHISRPETESAARSICAKYFQEETSPFRMCFRQLDVSPFMTMCMNELSAGGANQVRGDEDICRIGAFYIDECNRIGVPLRQPRACISCELTNGQQFAEAHDQKLQGTDVPQSADVVFVVSQKPCNSQVIPKLQKMLDVLEDTLVAKGLRRNRYGVVGFGGDGIHYAPHSHTIEGQLFNRNLKVGKMIGDLPIASDDSAKEAAMDAVNMAARYPFRAGVSKTIVLLTCQTCSENLISYPDMVELLLKRDIKLHLITPHDFRMKSNSPKASNIWGMTRYTVYTNKHANNLGGDPTLRRQTYMPKDLCGALAHETEGAIFNAKKFGDRKVKDFRTVVASVVANVATPSECQVCECMPDDTGVGQPVCHSCNQRALYYGLLPKFDEYIEANFLSVAPPPVQKQPPNKYKNRSKNQKRRRKN